MLIYLLMGAAIVILSIIFRLASALGLTLPLAYGLIAPTLFYDWFHSHQSLAEGIGWALVGFVVLCWVVSLIRKIRVLVNSRRDERIADEILMYRIKKAQAEGKDMSDVSMDGLYR